MSEQWNFGYTFLKAIGFVILTVVLLTAFYQNIPGFQAVAITYLLFMLSDVHLLVRGVTLDTEMDLLTTFAIAVAGLFMISVAFTFLGQTSIMGIFTITDWVEIPDAPLVINIGRLAFTLGISPALLVTVLIQLAGPTAEESFYRVFLPTLLTPVMGQPLAFIAQGIAFGVIHWFAYFGNIVGLASASAAGIWLGYIYMKSGNETAIALAHMTYNLSIILLASM